MKLITITTDFGNLNGFVGTMKGVIYGITPEAQIVDITHEIPAQDVRTGSLALWRAGPFFPAGTVHIAVVDPGVGTTRRPIAANLGNQFFVMPDNGLISPMLEDAEAAGSRRGGRRRDRCGARASADRGGTVKRREGVSCGSECGKA